MEKINELEVLLMERDQAIKYALNSMRMEGFEFTQQEKRNVGKNI